MLRALRRWLGQGLVDPAQLLLRLGPTPARRPPGTRRPAPVPPRRRRRTVHEADQVVASRLAACHAHFNGTRFGGVLGPIRIEVSRRLRSRLGYYRLGTRTEAPLIVISRRHLRRHGWMEVEQTLLHEMVHQWQAESGAPVDHGARFRAKARAVGAVPRARRPVGGDVDWVAANGTRDDRESSGRGREAASRGRRSAGGGC